MNSCKHTNQKQSAHTHAIKPFPFLHKKTSETQEIKKKNQLQLQNSPPSAAQCFYFILAVTLSTTFTPRSFLHSLICSLPDWLSICVFTVSTNHRLLKTKANPRPDIKSVWESPRCAALIHFSYPRGTSKSPSINREAALS